jgi:hypothetical protein
MKHQKLEIGYPLKIIVRWYDKVPEPPREIVYEGEVIDWRNSQVIVRVKEYAVVRFWKKNGLEVNNSDHTRRGFKIDLEEARQSTLPASGISIAIDTDA